MWQVELQLFNLTNKSWPKENIHVLISYDAEIGPSIHANGLINRFCDYPIFLYPDTRPNKRYPSTVRPHIIKKHFEIYPFLRKEAIFYIDSDVIFRKIPDFSGLLKDGFWYASNTRGYMSCNILIERLGMDIFDKMCNIVGIAPESVMEEEPNTGGAQYIIKNIPDWFWPKVEHDSNKLYDFLYDISYTDIAHHFFQRQAIDIYITEMWAVCWNAILAGKPFHIHSVLDFCWAHQLKTRWNETYMLHYTGWAENDTFRKTDFIIHSPFYVDLSYISNKSASAPLGKEISLYRSVLDKKRLLLENVTFLIPIDTDKTGKMDNLAYLLKFLDVKIILLSSRQTDRFTMQTFPENVIRTFNNGGDFYSHPEEFISTDYVGFMPSDCFLPIEQIISAIHKLSDAPDSIVFPFSDTYQIDVLLMSLFIKILEIDFLMSNKGKLEKIERGIDCCPFFVKTNHLSRYKEVNYEDRKIVRLNGYLFINKS